MKYNAVCPIGKRNCIYDPGFIKKFYPEFYANKYKNTKPEKLAKRSYCQLCLTKEEK